MSVVCVFRAQTQANVPIDDVTIEVYNDSQVLVASLLTGTTNPGEDELALAGSVTGRRYYVRHFKTGAGSFLAPLSSLVGRKVIQVIEPGASPTYRVIDPSSDIGAPTDPDLCRVYWRSEGVGVVRGQHFPPVDFVRSVGSLWQRTTTGGRFMPETVRGIYGLTGIGQLDAMRGATYMVQMASFGGESRYVRVPDETSADLLDLVDVEVTSFVATPAILALNVGEVAEVELTGAIFTDTYPTDPEGKVRSLCDFLAPLSSDEAIVRATFVGETTVQVVAVAAGAATVAFDRAAPPPDRIPLTALPPRAHTRPTLSVTVI